MYEADKLNRDDLFDKEQAPDQQLDAPQSSTARAPDMPELGRGGTGFGGGGGGKIDQVDQQASQKQHDMDELQRLKGLPPGHPDIESAKKPEAAAQKVPEGPGLTDAAKNDAAAMSPEFEHQGDAVMGDDPNAQPMTEPGGAGISIPQIDMSATLQGEGEKGAALGVADKAASTYASAEKANQEAPIEAVAEPTGEVAPTTPEQLTIEQPAAGPAPDAGAAAAPAAEVVASESPSAAQEHSLDVSEPEQEVLSDPEPEVIAEVAAPQVAAESVTVDAPAVADIATGDAESVQEASPVQVPDAAASTDVAPAGILVQSPTPTAAPEGGIVGELPAGDVSVQTETPPDAILVQDVAPTDTAALQDPSGPDPSAPAGILVQTPSGGAAGASVSLGEQAAGESVSVATPSSETLPTLSTETVQSEGAGAMPTAPSGDAAPAAGTADRASVANVTEIPVDTTAGQGARAETALAEQPVEDAAAGLGQDVANQVAGAVAAEVDGLDIYGTSAVGAGEQAKGEIPVQGAGSVAAIKDLAKNAKPELLNELGDSGATEALENTKSVAVDVSNTAQKLTSQIGDLDTHIDSFAKKSDDLETFRANPGERTKELLGKGEDVAAGLRNKAEESLGASLGSVKIHKGEGAREIADAIDATAFTQNEDIILGAADQFTDEKRDNVILEELAHVAQMQKGGAAGRSGVSSVADKSEKAAKAAARAIQDGAAVEGLQHDDERRAIYRNESTSADGSGATFPERVSVSLGGRSVTINLPQTPVEASKLVSLPSMNVPGLTMSANATLFFDTTTGAFKGGSTSGTISVGGVLSSDSRDIKIDKSGNMTATFPDANLKVGELIDATINASVGAKGVTAQGNIGVADLKGDKLSQWLKSGTLSVAVDHLGNATGSGNLGFEITPFSAGTLSAHIENKQLAGTGSIGQTANIDLGPAAKLGKGQLSAILTESSQLEIEGQLDLSVIPLPSGEGKANISWTSESAQIGGNATYSFNSSNRIEPTEFTKGTLTGSIAESKLVRLDGSGSAVYDNLFEGEWAGGGIDLLERKADYTLQGGLKQPLDRSPVKVSGGALTVQVAGNELTSTSGNVEFELADFMKGTAVLEAGTSKDTINATATAKLVSPKVFDEVKLSQGAAVVQVRGTEVKVVSGHVDLDFRNGVAVGKLDLSPTAQWDQLSGHGVANIRAGEKWGELEIKKGHVDLDVSNNRLVTAQGHAKFATKGNFEGNLSFNAQDNFAVLSGTSQTWLSKGEGLDGGIKMLADATTQFTGKIENSALTAFKGPMKWEHSKFAGTVSTTAWTTHLNQITGTGPADVKQPFRIGDMPGGQLTAQPGSKLTGHFTTGMFDGVSGTVNWQYHQWLAGRANIDKPTPGIGLDQLSGELAAGVIAPHLLENGSHIRLLESPIGSLSVKLQDGRPSHYSGNANFSFRDFAKGTVNITGEMLDFNTLQGASTLTVTTAKDMSGQSGVSLQPGGALAVTVENSTIEGFTGPANIQYADWMKGTVDAQQGSRFFDGITGRATGAIIGPVPEQASTAVRMVKGGTSVVDFVAGNKPIAWQAGSELAWEYESQKWLAGVISVSQQMPFTSITGESSASVVEEHLLPGSTPNLSLLPSSGLNVTFANNTINSFTGSAGARLEEWAEGKLVIEGTAGPTIFNGDLHGALVGDKEIDGTQLTLTGGGAVKIKVNQNRATNIQGDIPFKWGEGRWLGGLVHAEESQALRAITGPINQGTVIAEKAIGSFKLLPGGNISGNMNNADVAKIGGTANFQWQEAGEWWIGGKMALEGEQTPASMNGTFDGAVIAEKTIGTGLVLLPGAGLKGKIERNSVSTIAGDINFRLDDWLEGVVNVTQEVSPNQIAGDAVAHAVKDHHAQGNAYIIDYKNATFNAQLKDRAVNKIWGNIPWRVGDWIKGIADVADGTPSKVVGFGPGEISAPKQYAAGAGKVTLHEGGLTHAEINENGNATMTGPVQAEYVVEGSTIHPHVGMGGEATTVTQSAYIGTVKGGLMSKLIVPPRFQLNAGGDVTLDVTGSGQPGISGTFNFGWGGENRDFLQGSLEVANAPDASTMAGTIPSATINKEQTSADGNFTVLTGGNVYGKLINPQDVKLEGGDFGYRYMDWLEGTISIHGSLDITKEITGEGGATGALTRDLELSHGFTLLQGSGGEFYFEQNKVTKLWGAFGFKMGEDIQGTVLVEQGNSNADRIYGMAQAQLTQDMSVGSGNITLIAGSAFELQVLGNQWSDVNGAIGYRYDDEIQGHVSVQGGSTLHNISGEASGTLVKQHPVAGTSFNVEPGGTLTATMTNNTVDNVRGTANWSYGDLGWLRGTVAANSGSLDTISGRVKGSIAIEKFLASAPIRLKQGGSFQADFDGTTMTGFEGQIGIVYDGWLDGTAQVSGGELEKINGEVTASTKVRKELGQSAFLKPGATLIATFADSQLQGFAGSAAWQYETWLEGNLEIDGGSTLESISGSGSATLRERKQVGAKVELERGGNFKAGFAGSEFKGVGGEVGFIYDTWLGGAIKVPEYSKLDTLDGEAGVSVRHNKLVRGELELQQGGNARATLAGGDITSIQGDVNWRYGTWIGGNVHLNPSPLDGMTGSAEATILQHKPVGSGGFELRPGGAILVEFDATKDIAGQSFTGDVAWGYQNWLEGAVTVGAGATFDGIQGQATARLADDKQLSGPLLLKSGGNLTVELASSAPTTFGGDVLWHYEDWLAGTVTIDKGSSLEAINGEATAHLRKEKPVGGGDFKLLSGGNANVQFRAGAADGVHGHVNFGYQDWLTGGIELEQGSTFGSMTGAGTAHIGNDKPIGGAGFKIRAGTHASVMFENNDFYGLVGELRWGYQDWVEGTINVEKTKLDDISGDANAILVQDKPLGGKFTLLTGGNAQVKVQSGDITQWGGQVRVNYDNWLQGALNIQSPGPIDAIQGDVKGSLLQDKQLGKVSILEGAYLEAKFNGSDINSFGGKGRFKYDEWLFGAVTIDPASTPSSIGGDVRAQLAKDYSPGGDSFTLSQGGALKATFKDSSFGDLSGQANWKYTGDKAKVSGSLELSPSTFDNINGQAKAHLTGDMDAGNNLKILRGGELALEVQNSKPGTFSGRVNWQYQDWLKGNVQVASGTGFDGPYAGMAQARLDKAKTQGDVKFLRGGHLKMQFDSAAGLENTAFDGRVGVDYQTWLRGFIELEQATLNNLTGKARMSLKAGKDVGSTGIKLLQGSTANVHFANNALTGFDGTVRYRYEDWLQGTVDVLPGSNFESVSGDAHGQVLKPKVYDKFSLLPGSGVTLHVDNSQLGKFSGIAQFGYDQWLGGSLSLDDQTTKDSFYGHGAASVDQDHDVGSGMTLKAGSSALVVIEQSDLKQIGGTVLIGYEDWAEGALTLTANQEPKSLSGLGQLVTTQPKPIGSKTVLEQGSGIRANVNNSAVTDFDGNVTITYDDTVKGSLIVDPGSTMKSLTGRASVSLMKDIDLVGALKLKEGGNIQAGFSQEGLTDVSGTVQLEYDSWLLGTGRMAAGSTLDSFVGDATVKVIQRKEFGGGIALEEGSFLAVSFDANGPTSYKGNIDVTFDEWLKGTLNFEAQDLNSITGFGSMLVQADKKLVGPLSILEGSYIKVNVANSDLKDFEGMAQLGVEGWGNGQLTVDPGSTTDSISGYGQISLTEPKSFGDSLTLTSGNIGATVKNSELTGIYGEAEAEITDFGKGWVRVYKSSTLDLFDGQAGLALTQPKKIGDFAELSGGEVLANFKASELDSFGGWAEIKVYGWGSGKVMVDNGSTMDHIKGSAALTLEGPKEFAGGKLKITHGSVNASVDGQEITEIGGKVGIELTDVARGEVYGTLNVKEEKFTGGGKVEQIKEWEVGPAKIRDGRLEANIVDNDLKSASGGATIDAGRFGQGKIEVNFIRNGDEDIIYGKAELQFQPHDRIKGILKAQLTEDKKLIGEGRVIITISAEHNITGEAAVILREDEHVVLQGKVNIPGPYALFKPDPYKKDITLIDKGFVVYAPPMVKVNVGAGLGVEAGITPLEISNIVLSGECDLMEPEYAEMSVSGHMASSAYVDLNAYVEGSVSVSAAVVAVEAGLRATLNLHLEAAISADPTISLNRNGLSFDMPVTAELSAALNLILDFFAKVRVGIDVGLFSIMKTVWRYGYRPDPLQLARMAIGARGHVHAGPDGFDATMEPEYTPPDLTIAGLKKSLGLD